MNSSIEKILIDLLDEKACDLTKESTSILSSVYINAVLMASAMPYLDEQFWLVDSKKEDLKPGLVFKDYIAPFFTNELLSLIGFSKYIASLDSKKRKKISSQTNKIEFMILNTVKKRSSSEQREFAIFTFNQMMKHFLNEESRQADKVLSDGHQGLRLYRAFDSMDEFFNLNYQKDADMEVDFASQERLYQGSGVGVQSGYSSILLAIKNIDLKSGDHIVDLGSGYGRVGLAYSLLRNDIRFTGFEYVPHRVDNANRASEALGLEEKLKYHTQDLSEKSFQIPDADVFYIYDSFSDSTYDHVLNQIVEMSHRKRVSVVTKGNASFWLEKIASKNGWPLPLRFDHGNLCIFKSRS